MKTHEVPTRLFTVLHAKPVDEIKESGSTVKVFRAVVSDLREIECWFVRLPASPLLFACEGPTDRRSLCQRLGVEVKSYVKEKIMILIDSNGNEFNTDSTEDAKALANFLPPGWEVRVIYRSEVQEQPVKSVRAKKSRAKKVTVPGICRGMATLPTAEHGPPGRGRAAGFCAFCIKNLDTEKRRAILAGAQAAA